MAGKKDQQPAAEAPQQQFAIQRVYVKDISFESPEAPMIFTQDWKPELSLEINTTHNMVAENNYEVVLKLNVNVKNGDKTAFIVEIEQAGIFTMAGFKDDDSEHALGSFCPSILYPYAREAVTSAVMRGGFPQLVLAPVNFEALYLQHKANKSDEGKQGAA